MHNPMHATERMWSHNAIVFALYLEFPGRVIPNENAPTPELLHLSKQRQLLRLLALILVYRPAVFTKRLGKDVGPIVTRYKEKVF